MLATSEECQPEDPVFAAELVVIPKTFQVPVPPCTITNTASVRKEPFFGFPDLTIAHLLLQYLAFLVGGKVTEPSDHVDLQHMSRPERPVTTGIGASERLGLHQGTGGAGDGDTKSFQIRASARSRQAPNSQPLARQYGQGPRKVDHTYIYKPATARFERSIRVSSPRN